MMHGRFFDEARNARPRHAVACPRGRTRGGRPRCAAPVGCRALGLTR